MARFDTPIQEISAPFEAASGLRDTIPGVARPTAEMIVAEMGTAMRRFPRADHVASWAGVAPGHHERAGKRTVRHDPPRPSLLAHRVGPGGPRRRADQEYLSQCAVPAARHPARQEARDDGRRPFDARHGLLYDPAPGAIS